MLLNQSRLLIRADGGPKVGTGHIMRMMALSQAFRNRGGEVAMVIGDLPKVLIRRLESEKIRLYQIRNSQGDVADAVDTREIALAFQPDWIALDGYRFDDRYQSTLASGDARILVMDDFGHAEHKRADMIVNQNVYSEELGPGSDESPARLSGIRYALLRDEFKNGSGRRIFAKVKRVLVTFGGADPDNWTIRTLQVLSDMNLKGLVVDCVVGSCYGAFSELEEFRRHANLSLRVHKNVDRMSPLMHRADLAIAAAGSTCYELARCGVPTIAIAVAPNQVELAKAMHQKSAMVCIDQSYPENQNRCANLIKLVRKLMHDQGQRNQLSKVASQLVDGRGAQRIADQMAASDICLRSATIEDATTLWRWRNDPEVRAVSFNTQPIELASHRSWLQGQLETGLTHIWLAQSSRNELIGTVRFQSTRCSQRSTISVIVDQAFRGRGVGSALIHAAVNQRFRDSECSEILAQIKQGNTASEKAFQNAGFQPIDPTVVKGVMASQYLLSKSSTSDQFKQRQAA